MPEYLAPGVYVEEIPSGNKPIEAAGTSTAGMIGVTARGPVNQPILVTSQGGFARTFGGLLHPDVFTNGRDALPYAAEGFFTNGGSRLYVVRVVGDAAKEATLALAAENVAAGASLLLATAAIASDDGTTQPLTLTGHGTIAEDTHLLIMDGNESEIVTVSAAATIKPQLELAAGLAEGFDTGALVILQEALTFAGTVAEKAEENDNSLTLSSVAGLKEGDTLLLDPDGAAELVTIQTIADKTLTLTGPLAADHDEDVEVATLADDSTIGTLASDLAAGAVTAFLKKSSAAGIATDDIVRFAGANGNSAFAKVKTVAGLTESVALKAKFINSHPRGTRVIPVFPDALKIHARDPGAWGNDLRVTLYPANLVSTKVAEAASPEEVSAVLGSAFGLFPGSVVVIDGALRREVKLVDTATGLVTFTESHGQELTPGMEVVSQEFTLVVERMEKGKAVESETFERISLNPNNPRHAPTVIGSWDGAASSSGGSNLIRLGALSSDAIQTLPLVTGLTRNLSGGDDDVGSINAQTYIGEPSENPGQRTGIFAMENEPAVSIVAVPGQTSVSVQQALVSHCEYMQYRFAVIDTPIGADLAAAREFRQNFDSTRCAIYYPSAERADDFGAPGDRRIIAPSGHVMGIYARTDTSRGVHKAPANEMVRGILSFDNRLDKGVQDILNPINLNCFRDFRSENRGLRVYGARVATSDPEFKYINVRRLLLMIEQSLDTGLQWAVFEPNDRMLWDTVKQSVTGFLTTIWRSGGLQGQTAEEAFFVNIGYDITMTQDDIDNGRMIVEIGVAPVKPAEFVIVKISQKTLEAQD